MTAIIVHGGAWEWTVTEAEIAEAEMACRGAAEAGAVVLADGGSALDGVETAVRILEDCPVLEAGIGSFPNQAGEIEMDALIMDGRTLAMGAVAAVQLVQHPISLARRVMVASPHNFLIGAGASAFADRIGFERCEFETLLAGPARRDFEGRKEEGRDTAVAVPRGDTVGAVAIDREGNIATATSTGGTPHKWPGRIGDSPLVGSGGYADNERAGASATGEGEALMRVLMSERVCQFVGAGLSAQAACEAAIAVLAERVRGHGGVIAVDRQGGVGLAFNTRAMPYAYVVDGGGVVNGR